jgi:UDP-N-acetylmuramyl pentapeptide phosphotransferase/UDP-N-acetylglucosamine-1-phosphate transferase
MSPGSLGLAALVTGLSYWTTSWFCSTAAWVSFLDHPNARSLHSKPTPRTGGLAILGSLAVGLLLAEATGWAGVVLWNGAELNYGNPWLWIISGMILLGVVSFWDDRASLPAGVRLAAHGLVAIGVVWGGGMAVMTIAVPLVGSVLLGGLAAPLTVLGLVWVANLYNFMDGMDGFAGGMTVLGFGMLGYLAWAGGSREMALIALLTSAAAAGFLFFNLPPARIFMGDVGSVPLGFLAGTLAVLGVRDGLFDLWVPVLIFSPFIVDATVTVLRRMLQGEKFWLAHREHYYQRLVLAGWGHRKTMLCEYALMLATGTTAVLYVHVTDPIRLALLLAWAIAYSILAWGVRAMERSPGDRGAGA